MKSLVKSQAKEGIWLEDVSDPDVGNNDVLIKIHKTAICGTDIHIYNWDEWAKKTIPIPMTTGHEYCGEIVELGSNVTDLKIGDIVSGEGHITCGRCRNCLGEESTSVQILSVLVLIEQVLSLNIYQSHQRWFLNLVGIYQQTFYQYSTHMVMLFIQPCPFNMVGEDVLITGAGTDWHHGSNGC